MLLIVGRTGSGKDYMAKLLSEKGLKQLKSYTTRPIRSDDDAKTHVFIKPTEVDNYPDKIATTVINGYDYFATKQQAEESDVYIIDPNGLEELVKNMPDTMFHIIYMSVKDELDRKTHAIQRATDKIKEEIIYNNRNAAEDAQFTEFEKKLKKADSDESPFPSNIISIDVFDNTYDQDSIKEFADRRALQVKFTKRLVKMLELCADRDIPKRDPADKKKILLPSLDETKTSILPELYVEYLLAAVNDDGVQEKLYDFLLSYIMTAPEFE